MLEAHAALSRPAWVIESDHGVIATLGAEPWRKGCEVWLEPRPGFGRSLLWVIHNARDILSEICFGRFAVASVANGDRAVEMLASKSGFELLEYQSGRKLYYLTH